MKGVTIMKKRLVTAILMLAMALTLVACGKDNSKSPFNVSGKTFEGTGECMCIWEDGVTKEKSIFLYDIVLFLLVPCCSHVFNKYLLSFLTNIYSKFTP